MSADANRRRRLRAPAPIRRFAAGIAAAVDAVRRGARALVAGDRPFVAVLVALLALGVVMLAGPARSFLDGRGRVELLEAKLTALAGENERLEQRTRELRDLDHVELMAREKLGLIRPGEVPYAIVPPEVDRPRITPPREPAPLPSRPWYERLWGALFR